MIVFCALYFILQLYLTQYHELLSDEGTHALIGIFYSDAIKNIVNFHSIDDVKNFALMFILKYPKISPYYPPLYHILLAIAFFINKSVFITRIFNILITVLTGLVVFEIGKKFGLKERDAFISLIFFLMFSLVFYYADRIMIDTLQALTFSLTLLYYIKIRREGKFDLKNIIILGILLALAFSTKFYSVFLPIIILVDAIFHNKKIIPYLILSMLVSLLILSPYLYFYINYKIYKLTMRLSNIPFYSNWVYFDVFSNFGIFIGIFVGISIIWFLYKNRRDALILSWLFIPLIVLLYVNNKGDRFALFLMPLYAISCGTFFNYLTKTKWKKIALICISILLSLQLIHNIYTNSQGNLYETNEIIKSIKKDGNILILSELPVHSAIYMLYGNFNGAKGNFIRPCMLGQEEITRDILDNWGIRYIIDQNNTLSNKTIVSLNLDLVKKVENGSIKLFEYKVKDVVDCNFICLLNGKLCKEDGFSKILELINNRANVTD